MLPRPPARAGRVAGVDYDRRPGATLKAAPARTRRMTRILIAWEFGRHLGHLARDLPLARACRDAGHEVVWAVPNLRGAALQLAGEGFTLVQTPVIRPAARNPAPPVNFADMLLREGYDDAAALAGSLQGWLGLIRLVSPAVVVHDYAPTALLAARVAGVPALVVGGPFMVPAARRPLPSIRPWDKVPQSVLHDAETALVARMNDCLEALKGAPLASLDELFGRAPRYLTSFEELDPFGPRPEARYLGPVFALGEQAAVAWSSSGRPRVFAYLRPDVPGCEALLDALQATDAEVLCAMSGLPPSWPARFDRLRFVPGAIDLDLLLPGADLVVTSGSGTIASSLLAGVPVLVLPQYVEQYLAGLCLHALGAGLTLREPQTTMGFLAMLNQLVAQPGPRAAARAFAARHADHDRGRAAAVLFDALQALVAGGADAAAPG